MSDLWIYRRRPSSLTRYRHGGAAAFDPAVRSPLVNAVAIGSGSLGRDEEKILQFPSPVPAVPSGPIRAKRADKPRGGRAKPTLPKKRDS
ncbi:MAG: hypothetical protein OEZ03_16155 [Alphaproteobacteria bacterium]|nr:hypothetical protein [Alphaproteobacteria bacterium]